MKIRALLTALVLLSAFGETPGARAAAAEELPDVNRILDWLDDLYRSDSSVGLVSHMGGLYCKIYLSS